MCVLILTCCIVITTVNCYRGRGHTKIGNVTVCLFVCLKVFNATFNNISVISWRSVLLLEDQEKTTDLSQVTDGNVTVKICNVTIAIGNVTAISF